MRRGAWDAAARSATTAAAEVQAVSAGSPEQVKLSEMPVCHPQNNRTCDYVFFMDSVCLSYELTAEMYLVGGKRRQEIPGCAALHVYGPHLSEVRSLALSFCRLFQIRIQKLGRSLTYDKEWECKNLAIHCA